MAGFVIAIANIVAQRRVEAEVVHGVLDREVGCREVVQATGDEHAHVGILADRAAERGAGVGPAIERLAEIPGLVDAHAQRLVLVVVGVAEFFADIIVEQHGVGRAKHAQNYVEIRLLADRQLVDVGQARIIGRNATPLVAQQLLDEARVAHAQVAALDVAPLQAGVARQAIDHFRALFLAQQIAAHQRQCVAVHCPVFGLGHGLRARARIAGRPAAFGDTRPLR